MNLIIFTDLDGTLLNPDDYRYDAAIPVIETLKKRQIPLIFVTSKTRAEVESLHHALQLQDPFIVENGSGIFVPARSDRFWVSSPSQDDYLECLGATYLQARQGLKAVSQQLGIQLRGFGDLSDLELQKKTGLSLEAVKLAKKRDFSEPFLTPTEIPAKQLTEVVRSQGFEVVVGDRFSHLIGSEAGKGKAVRWLVERYQPVALSQPIVTIGLGNSPNDLGMLEAVDHPIIIPGYKGAHPQLQERGWEVAAAVGSQGWTTSVSQLIQ